MSDGNGVGISITGSSSGISVTDGVISDNASDGLQISGCAPVVTGNVISDNAGVAVYISGGIPILAGNTISGNGYAFNVGAGLLETVWNANTVTGNDHGADVYVNGGTVGASTTWSGLGGSRVIHVTGSVTVLEGATLTIGVCGQCIRFRHHDHGE